MTRGTDGNRQVLKKKANRGLTWIAWTFRVLPKTRIHPRHPCYSGVESPSTVLCKQLRIRRQQPVQQVRPERLDGVHPGDAHSDLLGDFHFDGSGRQASRPGCSEDRQVTYYHTLKDDHGEQRVLHRWTRGYCSVIGQNEGAFLPQCQGSGLGSFLARGQAFVVLFKDGDVCGEDAALLVVDFR